MEVKKMTGLDNKLAMWAGFAWREFEVRYGGPPTPSTGWYIDGEYYGRQSPDFTTSLDACFKWLKPAIISKGHAASSILTWRTVLHKWLKAMSQEKAMDNEPALALCKVIEQYADGEQE